MFIKRTFTVTFDLEAALHLYGRIFTQQHLLYRFITK